MKIIFLGGKRRKKENKKDRRLLNISCPCRCQAWTVIPRPPRPRTWWEPPTPPPLLPLLVPVLIIRTVILRVSTPWRVSSRGQTQASQAPSNPKTIVLAHNNRPSSNKSPEITLQCIPLNGVPFKKSHPDLRLVPFLCGPFRDTLKLVTSIDSFWMRQFSSFIKRVKVVNVYWLN